MPAAARVRQATPADLADVTRLLSARDDRTHDQHLVSDYLWGLDPAETRAWIAHDGDRPVGLTMLYLRDLRWPADGAAGDAPTLRAGYWAHLYVDPDYRKRMIYPQLVMAMLRSVGAGDPPLIFTATRQPDVAAGHQKLGFGLVGTLPLRIRPLRPARLVAKHKNIGLLKSCSGAIDAAYRSVAGRRPRSGAVVDSIDPSDPEVESIVQLGRERTGGVVRQAWSVAGFRRRYRAALDGRPYRLTGVRRDGRLVAALAMAIAERGAGIRAGVLLDLVTGSAAEPIDARDLLADAEAFAHRDGAELMLSLDEPLDSAPAPARGYLTNRSEVYHLLAYPKPLVEAPHAAADLGNWLFTFGDHDAF